MPGNWRWGMVAAGVVWACAGGSVHAQGPAPALIPAGATLPPPGPMAPAAPLPPAGPPAARTTTPVTNTPVAPPTAFGAGSATTVAPTTLPPLETGHDETPLKDLTPPGFAEGGHEGFANNGRGGSHLNPLVPQEPGLFATAELLVWRPRRGAFDFAIRDPLNSLATAGPVQSLNYDISAGVRGELGYQFGHSGWDVFTAYTYFHTGANGFASADPGGVLRPTLTRPGLVTQAQSASALANLNYNAYDFGVGKRFIVDENFAVRTFAGLRFASIQQDFQVAYDGLDARGAGVSLPSNFQGFGPVVGAEAVLAGWNGLHLYARTTGGMLSGLSKNPYRETNDLGGTVYADTGYDLRKVVPMIGVGVGGGWQYRTVFIRAGYEITNYFNLIDQPRFTDDVTQGKFVSKTSNLSFEGLFVQVGLVF